MFRRLVSELKKFKNKIVISINTYASFIVPALSNVISCIQEQMPFIAAT